MKELFIVESGNKRVRVSGVFTLAVALLFLLVFFFGCSPAEKFAVDKSKPWAAVKFSIDKSTKYAPTFVLWVEDATGGDATTLYVTKKAAGRLVVTRLGMLPVWAAVKKQMDGPEDLDAVSSATPAGADAEFTVQIPDKYKGRKINFYIEANASYDYNEYFREGLKSGEAGYNDVNGQPSVIWMATVDLFATPAGKIVPAVAGHGDVLGASGGIESDMTDITTAASLIRTIEIEYGAGD